jgi:acetyltransferase-like isoleucine patch superfamily enzyme/glycosyltransferase involved in cell wall biosynthesis
MSLMSTASEPLQHAAVPHPNRQVGRAQIDVIIPTYNERQNLPWALQSVVGWTNQIFVLDSGSTDGTQDIAREAGVTLVEHPWEGYARQKNWALDNLPLTAPWTFILDADEQITPKLRDELIELCSGDADRIPQAGFYVNRYLIFLGKRIRHCGYFPSWNLRLFKRGQARYEDRPVHEHMIVNGPEGTLKGLLSHEDRRGLEYYIAKHNRYSSLEAETVFYGEHRDAKNSLKPALLGSPVQRRRYFRDKVYPLLPARWLWRFIYMYVLKFGFLDGRAGFQFSLLIASHEFFAALKLKELRRRKGLLEPLKETTHVQAEPEAGGGSANGKARPLLPQPPAEDRLIEMPSATEVAREPEHYASVRQRSPWSFGDKVRRTLWMLTEATLFRCSFHNWYAWRRLVLRAFGAKLGRNVSIRPSVHIEMPWNLIAGNDVVIGDHARIYSLGTVTIGHNTVISQYAHLCAGTHDYTTRHFTLLCLPITIGEEVWIAADAFVGPGVTVGPGTVVGARASVFTDLPPSIIAVGNPAKPIKERMLS